MFEEQEAPQEGGLGEEAGGGEGGNGGSEGGDGGE